MRLVSLYLKNFRSYSERLFEFDPRLNMICGPNARGKTTILEAIYLLITGRSFRTAQLKELIKYDQSEFVIELVFIKHGVEQSLKVSYSSKERRILHNSTPCRSINALLGLIPGSATTPDDLLMIKGQPKLRRKYLDIQLAQADPLYVYHLSRYQKAMHHRNILLKLKNLKSIEIWENEMANSAAYIADKRYQAVEDLQKYCAQFLSKISRELESMDLTIKSQCPREELNKKGFYLELYHKVREREILYGSSLAGPHKDDLHILLNGKDARHFSSEGQQRSCISALRFAEWQNLRKLSGEEPLMLIDDFGGSFDSSRRTLLFEHLSNLEQVFLTATETNGHSESGSSVKVINLV